MLCPFEPNSDDNLDGHTSIAGTCNRGSTVQHVCSLHSNANDEYVPGPSCHWTMEYIKRRVRPGSLEQERGELSKWRDCMFFDFPASR